MINEGDAIRPDQERILCDLIGKIKDIEEIQKASEQEFTMSFFDYLKALVMKRGLKKNVIFNSWYPVQHNR